MNEARQFKTQVGDREITFETGRLAGQAGGAVTVLEDEITEEIGLVLADTAEIGAAGAGLTAIPWNAAWDAEVQSEVTDGLNAYDPPTKAELDAGFAALNDISVADVLTTQMTEAYAADGVAPTLAQALFLIQQKLGDFRS